ncbi:MAG TPA: hypothetical protein VL687_00720 [Methylomirabilota bacterium]|nr:hypothetical protein [Methylomirabilota bacterium]
MTFWSRSRRGEQPDEAPSLAVPTATHLSVVEFWAPSQRTLAGMDLSRERLTDLINREEYLPVVLLNEQPEDISKPIEMRAGQQWSHLKIEDALLVLPPPQVTNPLRRLHRPRQPVEIVIGPFTVTGMVSVPPGAQAAGFLFRQNARFAAVTRAVVRDIGMPGFEQHAEVMLVNMRRVDTIHDVGLDQPEVITPPEATTPIR